MYNTVQHFQGAFCWTSPWQGTLAQPQKAANPAQTSRIPRAGALLVWLGKPERIAQEHQPLTSLGS